MNRVLIRLFLLCLCAFVCLLKVTAQWVSSPPNIDWFHTGHGLPHNSVNVLIQDRVGYLWVGTNNGLCRYNGFEFQRCNEAFSINPKEDIVVIDALFEDRSGNIWVGTRNGEVSCYQRAEGSWRVFESRDLAQTPVKCFYEDQWGNIWIGTREGLLARADRNARKILLKARLKMEIIGITSTTGRQLLILSGTLFLFSIDNNSYRPVVSPIKSRYPLIHSVGYENFLMALDGHSLYLVDSTGLPGSMKWLCKQDERELHWLGTSYYRDRIPVFSASRIRVFSSRGKELESFSYPNLRDFLSGFQVTSVFMDRDNIIWLTTRTGLIKIDRAKFRFRHLLTSDSPSGNNIRAISLFEDHLWIGTRKALPGRFKNKDAESGEFIPFSFRNEERRIVKHTTVNAFFKSREGVLYAGCQEGLAQVDIAKQEVRVLHPGRNRYSPLIFGEIWSLLEDGQGRIWVGTNKKGLIIWDPRVDTFGHYTELAGLSSSSTPLSVWTMMRDHAGVIWLGTSRGVYRFVESGQDGILTGQPAFRETQIGKHQVWNILEDRQKRLWIGTTDEGLYMVNASRNQVDKKEGLPGKVVSSLVEDRFGAIWVGTMFGLVRISPDGEQRVYTEENGLISGDFNFKSVGADAEGHLHFGTKLGLVAFDPADFLTEISDGYAPVSSGFWVMGNERDKLLLKDTIYLENQENFFQIGFSLLHYRCTGKSKFRYRLEGFENTWNQATNGNRFARYTKVPPGHYIFRLEASMDGHAWYPESNPRHIVIQPAFWQRTGFQVSGVSILLLIIGGVIRGRFYSLIRREKEKSEFARKLGELELQALRAQMNPHFIFNCIHSIQHYVLHHDEMAANDYLTSFARLMRLFLESSRHKFITLEKETELLTEYVRMELLRFEHSFDFHISREVEVPPYIKIPTMIIQPFIENSIVHGLLPKKEKGYLDVSFRREKERLICCIEDNGIGRKKAAESKVESTHESLGIGLVQERMHIYQAVEAMQGEIYITDKDEDGVPSGTRVEIFLTINEWRT